MTSCPSAPILNTLARKHMANPTEINNKGATLTPTSDQPRKSLMGSRKKTAKLANGSLPTARNRTRPQAMVSNTASTGENHAIHIDGCARGRSEEHTSELQSLMRISYAVFCLKKKKKKDTQRYRTTHKKNPNDNYTNAY